MTELTLTPAPVGVGFITCDASVAQFRQTALPILEKYSTQQPSLIIFPYQARRSSV